MSKRLVVFNHKGGVSKTTSTYNMGWKLAEEHNVLLVDADPQCNLSGLILGENFDNYYLSEETCNQNIKDGVSAAFDGKPIPIQAVDCAFPQRQPTLFLLAGHANLSEYDAALTFAQTSNNAISTLQNLPGAFSRLLELTEARYHIDYTIIDLNPGLSAINQNLFLISDAFIIPTNPDPFSIMALETLRTLLPRWVTWKAGAVNLFADSAYPLPEGTPKFLGCLIQRFNVRKGRAARPYRDNIDEIKDKISGPFYTAIRRANMTLAAEQYGDLADRKFCLAEIPDFQSLLPKSNEAGVPIFALTDQEIKDTGPLLVNAKERRDKFNVQFGELALEIAEKIDYA